VRPAVLISSCLLACARPFVAPVLEIPERAAVLAPPSATVADPWLRFATVSVIAADVVDVYAVEGAAIGVFRAQGAWVLARLRDGAPIDREELGATLPPGLGTGDDRCPTIRGIVGRWPDTLWLGFEDACAAPLGTTQFLRFQEGRWRWAGLRSPSGERPVWTARPEWQHGVGAVFAWSAPEEPPSPGWILPDFFPAAQETPMLFAIPLHVEPDPGASVWISPRTHLAHAVGRVAGDVGFGLQVAGTLDLGAPEWIAAPIGGTDDVLVAGVRGEAAHLARRGKEGWALMQEQAPPFIHALRGDPDRRLWAIAGEERSLWVRSDARWTPVGWDPALAAGATRALYFVSADERAAVLVAEDRAGVRAVVRVAP
jgi:hypothetical protein